MKKIIPIILALSAALSASSCASEIVDTYETTDNSAVVTTGTTSGESDTEAVDTTVGTADPDETTEPATTTEEVTTEPVTTKEHDPSAVVTDGNYDYFSDISKYLKYLDPTLEDDPDLYILANKTHVLAEDFVPKDLVDCGSGVKNCMLSEYTNGAYRALVKEMKSLGISTYCQSGYRSFAEQTGIFNKYIKQEKSRHLKESDEQIRARVGEYSAFPGSSEHQTGYAIDFKPISDSFENTEAFKYMKDNAHKFGFILRYGKGQTDITGYQYEPWHWRFVGRTAAEYIHEHKITLEEYLIHAGLMPEDNYPAD